jgi:cysteine synthase A
MSNFADKIKKLRNFVGNTPLIKIIAELDGKEVVVYAKYEAWNFSGSIKDRMALQILQSAENLSSFKQGDTIVEATSGNTGIAFAAMGAFLGSKVEIYMPSWLSEERKSLLRFYGAKLIEIDDKQGGFSRCIELSHEKSKKKGYFGPKQFNNAWNVYAHMSSTAPELDEALKQNNLQSLDNFVTGAGTGGTIMGFHHYFSNRYDNFKAFPVFPISNVDKGHRIEGIGDSFVPEILDLSALNPIIRVSDSDAINIARQINKLGLSVGISSGANVFSAVIKASESDSGITATILCDDNKKYLSTDLCADSEEQISRDLKIKDFLRLS